MRTLLLSCMAASVMLSGCGAPSANGGVMKGQERSGGLFGMATADSIKVETPDAFKAADQVMVGTFTVGFATYKTDSSKAGGGLMGGGFGGKSTAKSTLSGIDDATMQKITDEAYKKFVADLKAKGYSVQDRAKLAGNDEFAKTKSYPVPYEDESGSLFGTNSRTKYFAPSSFGGLKVFPGDIAGTMGGFAFDNPLASTINFAKANNVRILNVVYVIDFANAEKYGSWASSSSNVTVGQGMTVIPEYSKLAIYGGDVGSFSTSNGVIRLGQPLSSEKPFATVTDSTSETAKGVEMATNVIGAIGGIGTNAKREFEFKARPADYKAAALDVLGQANDAVLGKMQSLK